MNFQASVPILGVPCSAVSTYRRLAFDASSRPATLGRNFFRTVPSGATIALAMRGSYSLPPLDSDA